MSRAGVDEGEEVHDDGGPRRGMERVDRAEKEHTKIEWGRHIRGGCCVGSTWRVVRSHAVATSGGPLVTVSHHVANSPPTSGPCMPSPM